MNRGLKIGGLVVLLLGAGVGAYFLFRKKDEEDSPTPSPRPSSNKYKDNSFPLKKNSGDVGQSVKRVEALQRFLNSKGSQLSVDGKFGPKTLLAVQTHIGASEVSEAYYNQNVKPFEDASYSPAVTTPGTVSNLPATLDADGDGVVDFLQDLPNINVAQMDNTDTIYNNSNLSYNPNLYSDTIPDMVTGNVMFSGNGNSKKTWFDDLEVGY